jgi:hypothetical protein
VRRTGRVVAAGGAGAGFLVSFLDEEGVVGSNKGAGPLVSTAGEVDAEGILEMAETTVVGIEHKVAGELGLAYVGAGVIGGLTGKGRVGVELKGGLVPCLVEVKCGDGVKEGAVILVGGHVALV